MKRGAARAAAWPALVALALTVVVAVSGCGSSSHATSTSSTTSSSRPSATVDTGPAGGLSAAVVERGLVAHGGPPAPTRAACHPASTAERSAAPFGSTKLPIFVCTLTLRGTRGTYAVQVQQNNCFVAERRGGGQAVYGCGIRRS